MPSNSEKAIIERLNEVINRASAEEQSCVDTDFAAQATHQTTSEEPEFLARTNEQIRIDLANSLFRDLVIHEYNHTTTDPDALYRLLQRTHQAAAVMRPDHDSKKERAFGKEVLAVVERLKGEVTPRWDSLEDDLDVIPDSHFSPIHLRYLGLKVALYDAEREIFREYGAGISTSDWRDMIKLSIIRSVIGIYSLHGEEGVREAMTFGEIRWAFESSMARYFDL